MAKEQTISERVLILENKDVRRDQHYIKLNKQIEELTRSQTQMIELLAGTELNDKKGFIKLIDKTVERVDIMSNQNIEMKKDMDNTKFWGRTATAIFIALFVYFFRSTSN
jgi:uncharacterized protein YueI